ncbi:MAG: hypothetical protein ACP5QG_03205 [candidate division WOR-3 bacterium]
MEILSLLVSLWLSGLILSGDGPPSPEYRDLIGRELTPGLIDTLSERALAWCAERGFPLARAQVISVERKGDSAVVFMRVERGAMVILRDVSVDGREASPALRRCFSGAIGLPYSPQRTAEAISLARDFGFGELGVSGFSLGERGFIMRVERTGGASMTILGSGSYDPSDGNAFGFLELVAPNIAGTGRCARLSWERLSLLSQSIDGTYREPWVLGGPLWLELGAGYAFAESLYMTREVFYKAVYPFSGETELWAGQSWQDARDFNAGTNSSGFFLLAGGTWAGFRPRIFPEKGFMISLDSRLSSSLQRTSWETGLRLPILFLTAGLSTRGGFLRSDKPTLVSDLFRIGGHLPPRGYRPERFFLENYSVVSAELGFRGVFSPFGFLDWCPANDLPSPFSYGGGLRLRGKNLGLEAMYARSAGLGERGLLHISLAGLLY